MYRKLIGACAGLAMMGMAGTASAITFNSEATFLAAISDPTLESFESLTATNTASTTPITTPNFTVGVTGAGDLMGLFDTLTLVGSGISATDGSNVAIFGTSASFPGTTIVFTFPDFIDAFGFNITDFGDLDGSLLYSTGSGEFGTIATAPADGGDGSLLFFGLTTDIHFTTFTIQNTAFDDGIGIDELYFTEAPEPSTLALFATGLALLAFLGWRRRRHRTHAAA